MGQCLRVNVASSCPAFHPTHIPAFSSRYTKVASFAVDALRESFSMNLSICHCGRAARLGDAKDTKIEHSARTPPGRHHARGSTPPLDNHYHTLGFTCSSVLTEGGAVICLCCIPPDSSAGGRDMPRPLSHQHVSDRNILRGGLLSAVA